MKTSEEIKRGLKLCSHEGHGEEIICEHCPYDSNSCAVLICTRRLSADALAYIQQLENEVSAWKRAFSQIGDDGGVVRRELAHQRELIKKNVEMRRLEEAYHKLEAQVPRWISVEERMPEAGNYVLCFCEDEDGYEWHTVGRVQCWDDKWDLDIDTDHEYREKVTHWMQLPEPPKEDDHAAD